MAMTEEEHDALVEALAQVGVLRDVVAFLLAHITEDKAARAKLLDSIEGLLALRQAARSESDSPGEQAFLRSQEEFLILFSKVIKLFSKVIKKGINLPL